MISEANFLEEEAVQLAWPQELSHEPTLKIGEVLNALKAEFPFLAASKIRYFESQELIVPQRTASNQRRFSPADVERLRFILTEQRDRYISLPHIKEMLKQLDLGDLTKEHPGKLRALNNGVPVPNPNTRLRKSELATLTGVSVATVERYVNAGLLIADSRGRLTAQSINIVRYVQMLEAEGMDIRSLKAVRNSAHAHGVNILNLMASELGKNTPVGKERVLNNIAEISEIMTNFYRALLLEDLDVQFR